LQREHEENLAKSQQNNAKVLTNNVRRGIINNVDRAKSPNNKEEHKMSNPNMESIVKELLELKRMKEELEAEITAMEDEIKKVMGDEELLTAGAFKVSWKNFISSRVDTTALKKAMPEIAEQFTKQTKSRRFAIN